MRSLRVRPLLTLLTMIFAGTAGCGSPPPPDGFALGVQFRSVSATAIDTLRITLTPRDDASGSPRFMDIDPEAFEGGAVTIDVEPDGVLVMTITGDYVRSHLTTPDPMPRFEIDVWSDDEATREGPQVRATVIRGAEQIATGAGFLPAWPPPLGGGLDIQVPCSPGFTSQCAGM